MSYFHSLSLSLKVNTRADRGRQRAVIVIQLRLYLVLVVQKRTSKVVVHSLGDIRISYLRAARSSYMKNLVYVLTPNKYVKYPLGAATGSTNLKYILQISSRGKRYSEKVLSVHVAVLSTYNG